VPPYSCFVKLHNFKTTKRILRRLLCCRTTAIMVNGFKIGGKLARKLEKSMCAINRDNSFNRRCIQMGLSLARRR